MKRIRVYACGEPEVMQLEEAADPRPEAGQILVQVQAAGVNPVDTYLRSGKQGYSPSLPYTPGFDAAGIVEAVGDGVNEVAEGDRVYCARTLSGAYAEKAICDRSQVHRLPEQVSFAQGAAVGVPYGTAYRALFHRAQAMPGEVVLVHGASGGVGLAAVQLARAAGMVVIGTAGTAESQQLVLDQGARFVLNHHTPEHFEQILELTQGQGVAVVLEMLANVNLGQDLKILAKGGRVVVIGSRGDVQITPRDLMGRDAAVLGMALLNATPQELSSIHAFLVTGLENGTLRPVIGKEFPLAEAPQAHHLVMESHAYGKIVLIP
ncbi:zinc-binding dehydrogenase [candidate division KSB3 bacterium]|uniref:Zinc-binding dehydrogenase n=1 Tax=candidate division KSB3 bacterium TaxID=2044937 RepID=A0A9D5JU84_9BACT|nr:zinc-binding dehydrogenase [candidate division KSB3 bacterium]MBD3324190.1 zinc-binding dehydrogenase [candidate division KSB3 bacterium]